MSNRVPLARLARELAAMTGGPAPSYGVLWNKVVTGQIKSEQAINGRYTVDPADAAKALGLKIISRKNAA